MDDRSSYNTVILSSASAASSFLWSNHSSWVYGRQRIMIRPLPKKDCSRKGQVDPTVLCASFLILWRRELGSTTVLSHSCCILGPFLPSLITRAQCKQLCVPCSRVTGELAASAPHRRASHQVTLTRNIQRLTCPGPADGRTDPGQETAGIFSSSGPVE